MAINDDIIDAYRDQLGREPTETELANAASRVAGGASLTDLEQGLNRSLEGQNYDTQYLTSQYRQLFARNPEQEGYQYWLSQMQQDPTRDADIMRQYLIDAASAMDAEAYARSGSAPLTPGGYTQFTSADVQADPYSGRYATTSIYDLPTDAVNVSDIYGTRAQFVNPLNEAAVISSISGQGAWQAGQGLDVLNNDVVRATINRALDSGAMSRDELRTLQTDLTAAKNMDDVRAAFGKPQATVMLDAQYGLQTGQGNTVAEAQARAADMQAVLDALDSQYYPSNMAVVAPAAAAAGVDYAFGPSGYQGYNTMMTGRDVVTPANFQQRVNQVNQTLSGISNFNPMAQAYQRPTFNIDANYNPYALPTEQTTQYANPYQAGLEALTGYGGQLAYPVAAPIPLADQTTYGYTRQTLPDVGTLNVTPAQNADAEAAATTTAADSGGARAGGLMSAYKKRMGKR